MRRPRPEQAPLRDAAKRSGISYYTLYDRVMRQGMTIEEAAAAAPTPGKARPKRGPAPRPWSLSPDQLARQAALRQWRRALPCQ